MKIQYISAGILAIALVTTVPAMCLANEEGDFQQALAAAQEARKKAASVGGEWRDVGKLLEESEQAAKDGDYTKATKLAAKAKMQGELGYRQALDQKDAGMPQYMIADSGKEPTASAVKPSAGNRISTEIESVTVMHKGKEVIVTRGSEKAAILPEEFLKTDRGCPPFCIQPIVTADGVATVGELEVLEFLHRSANGDTSILVVDSRTPDWVMRGTIPGAVNIPWNQLGQNSMTGMFGDATESSQVDDILEKRFGAKKSAKGWDFSDAKTLILFCNGIWCPQSSNNIATLLNMGYPAAKLKWYRGGMQDWVSVGLTTVDP